MDLVMSEDIEAVRDLVNRFMQAEVVPIMDGYEQRGEFPREMARLACATSARTTWLPVEHEVRLPNAPTVHRATKESP